MLKHRNKLIAAAGAVVTAGAIATTGVMTATAASHPARVSGTENFQMMTTSATSTSDALIASGVFTAPGVDHENRQNNTSMFVFANGTVSLKHSPGKGTQSVNPKTCLLTVNFHGTYTLTGGTGAYAGITGSGTYKLSILAIAARSGGKCSTTAPPAAWQQVIRATGPVNL